MPPSHSTLKSRQRAIRDAFPEPLALRVHRAISWIGRAEDENDDLDVKFILLWIAFNAAYASEIEVRAGDARLAFTNYFAVLVELDGSQAIYSSVWERFSQEIRLLLDNPYIFAPFWSHHNGVPGYDDHKERLAKAKSAVNKAFSTRDTATLLSIMFDRLYVLRNQLVHGGATWNSGVNRAQVRDGAAVLSTLVPIFISIMMDHPTRDWGKPFYPVVG
jgi:Apea-like HEPN